MVTTTLYIPTNMDTWGSYMPAGIPTITLATTTQVYEMHGGNNTVAMASTDFVL
jgi:hypothetical protein